MTGNKDIHEGKEEEQAQTDTYEPTEEEEKIVNKVNLLMRESKEWREKYDKDWIEDYMMFRGRQWQQERPPYRHSECFNMIFQNIQSMIPILTDTKPKIEFLPTEVDDEVLVEILNYIVRDDWERNNWLYVLTEALYDAHFYGIAYGCTEYDPDLRDGLGNATFRTAEPLYCYVEPDAQDINVENSYFIEAVPTAISKIKRKWPTKGKYVKTDIDDYMSEGKDDYGKIKFKSPTENVVAYETTRSKDSAVKKALLIKAYIKDEETVNETIEEQNEKGEIVKKQYQKLKYPKGRKIVIANNIVLQKDENPYEDGEFPYERLINYILPREFYGMSEISQLKSPQRVFNKVVSFALDCLTLMGNPIWVLDSNSGVDSTNLFNSPGLIVSKRPGSEVRRESGTHLQPYVLQMIDRLKMWFDDISGSNDVSRGANPPGVSAGIAIQTLQDATFTRLRQKSRNMDAFLQKVGQHYLSRVLQFYKAPRIIRLTNENEANRYFKVMVEESEVDGKMQRHLGVIQYKKDEITGKMSPSEKENFNLVRNFDIRVQTGSALPFARVEKEAKLLQYYDRGLIDREEVLKNADLPNWESINQRMNDKEAIERARMEEQQAQQTTM